MLDNRLFANIYLFIIGDLNVNILNDSLASQSFVNNLQSYHFIPLITKPTRFSSTAHNPSLLDHIWTNELTLLTCGVIMTDVTDHCMTFLRYPISNMDSEHLQNKIEFRLHNEENKNRFTSMLETFNWNSIASDDVNVYTDNFTKTIDFFYCKCFPIKVKYISNKQLCTPWISSNLKKLISYKSQYFNLFRMGIVSDNNYKTYKNKVKSILKKSKNQYYKTIFDRNKNCLKKTWKLIKSLVGKNITRDRIKKLFSIT